MPCDDGYFPRGTSMLRRVHEERAVGLFYGQRALCIGALAPLNYVGTSEHTANKTRPFRRLAHTARAFEAVMLGSRADADAVLASRQPAKRVHDLIMLGALPPRVRTLYGLPWSAAHAAAFRAAVTAARSARPLLPGWILRGSNRISFELVEATEASRIEAGRRTPQ